MACMDQFQIQCFKDKIKVDVTKVIRDWLQNIYKNIQHPKCAWCLAEAAQMERCHVGPKLVEIIELEFDTLWTLSTEMGRIPSTEIFKKRLIERVKLDHVQKHVYIEIACAKCNPKFEHMPLSDYERMKKESGKHRKRAFSRYHKNTTNEENEENAAKKSKQTQLSQFFSEVDGEPKEFVPLQAPEPVSEQAEPVSEPVPVNLPDRNEYERFLKDRERCLNDFIKSVSTSSFASETDLLENSYVTDKNGTPVGSTQTYVNKAYNAWMKSIDETKYVAGSWVFVVDTKNCCKFCKTNGCQLSVCPRLKTHLSSKLGRQLNGKNDIWKTSATKPKNVRFYKNLFLKKNLKL